MSQFASSEISNTIGSNDDNTSVDAELNIKDSLRAIEDSFLRMRIGQVVSVNGARVLIMVNAKKDTDIDVVPRLGSMVCIETGTADIVAGVAGLSSPTPGLNSEETDVLIAELELVGEFRKESNERDEFRRGISTFPALGDMATWLTTADKALIYGARDKDGVLVGKVSGTNGMPAKIKAEDFLHGNFAIFGADGSGKSCATALIIRALVKSRNPARIVLFDQHNEYTTSFGRAACIMPVNAGVISHWMLTFKELTHVLEVEGGVLTEDELELLTEAIGSAKKRYLHASQSNGAVAGGIGNLRTLIDLPIPYRVSDVITFFDRTVNAVKEYDKDIVRHLRTRIDSISRHQDYRAIFGNVAATDTLEAFLSQVFRIPLNKQPITILQMGDLPQIVCEVLISVIARNAQILANAQKGQIPILLLVEEAQHYLPTDTKQAPLSSQALLTILERGAKQNINIGLISPKLRSLSLEALESCSTMLAMRMPSILDQDKLLGVTPETASGLLAKVGVIDKGECIAVGRGVTVPMRFSFGRLPPEAVPMEPGERLGRNEASLGTIAEPDASFLESVVQNWRFSSE